MYISNPSPQYIYPPSENRTDNKQLFYNIGVLDEAIRKNQKVSFEYVEYHTDKKLYSRKREDGTIRIYIVKSISDGSTARQILFDLQL